MIRIVLIGVVVLTMFALGMSQHNTAQVANGRPPICANCYR